MGYKRKYHRGRVNPNHDWIFGMIQRDTRKVALIIVPNRGANDLILLIQRTVLPGTTIMSDRWAAYNQLSTLGYRHLSVNHSDNFIDPATGAHTQPIEEFWGHSKALFKSMRGGGLDVNSFQPIWTKSCSGGTTKMTPFSLCCCRKSHSFIPAQKLFRHIINMANLH